jgi:rhodanese-related sulfurtransferase
MNTAAATAIEDLDPEQVIRLLNEDRIVLIDVREPHEYAQQRIAGARLVPLSRFDAARLPRDPQRRLVFQCGTGMRSRNAAELCLRAGEVRVAHLAGGILAWRQAGFATVCDAS